MAECRGQHCLAFFLGCGIVNSPHSSTGFPWLFVRNARGGGVTEVWEKSAAALLALPVQRRVVLSAYVRCLADEENSYNPAVSMRLSAIASELEWSIKRAT